MSRFRKLSITSKLLLLTTVLLLIFILVAVKGFIVIRQETQRQSAGISPLLFGANLDYQILTSPRGQILAKHLGLRSIRLGDNSNGTHLDDFYSKARLIKNLGLVPLIILHDGVIADPEQRLAIDTDIVNKIQQIFGGPATKVYYEFGNESDLNPGINADTYTNMWNSLLPMLRPLAPHSWFGGPVNFQQNPAYISYFVHHARPQPDFISWHAYTCGHDSAASDCIKYIDNWTTHVNNTRHAITANSDPVPPIMITEWNYSPGGISDDGKRSDPLFLAQWTAKALQTLTANNIFAAYLFNVDGSLGLVDSENNPTMQGLAFYMAYEHLIDNVATSTPKYF
jgi:hypothetical protein